MTSDRRRAARIQSSFWARVKDVQEQPELVVGNISISGVFFNTDKRPGSPGEVRALEISTYDKSATVETLALVVRVISVEDLGNKSTTAGAAFQFLFENAKQRKAAEELVRRVVDLQVDDRHALAVDYQLPAQVESEGGEPRSARLERLSLDRMLIETDWPVHIGDAVRIEIEAPRAGKTVGLTGKAVARSRHQQPDGQERYRVDVRVEDSGKAEAEPGIGGTIADAVNALLSEAATWHTGETGGHHAQLSGLLSKGRLQSLLAFFDLERVTGVCVLRRQAAAVTLYLREGRVIDAEGEPPGAPPIETLRSAMAWEEGSFGFTVREIDRKDVIGLAPAALVVELSRKA